jgi:integrase
MGIDIRKISSGLGHSSVQVTERHYMQSVQDAILDQINEQITRSLQYQDK